MLQRFFHLKHLLCVLTVKLSDYKGNISWIYTSVVELSDCKYVHYYSY